MYLISLVAASSMFLLCSSSNVFQACAAGGIVGSFCFCGFLGVIGDTSKEEGAVLGSASNSSMAYRTRRKLDYTPAASVLFGPLRFGVSDPSPAPPALSSSLTRFFDCTMSAAALQSLSSQQHDHNGSIQ